MISIIQILGTVAVSVGLVVALVVTLYEMPSIRSIIKDL